MGGVEAMTTTRTALQSLEAAAADMQSGIFKLTLYVAGANPRSTRAIEKVRRFCDAYLANRHDLDIVDLYEHPGSARSAGIIAVPTLVRELPAPVRKLIGDMRDETSLFASLGIPLPVAQ